MPSIELISINQKNVSEFNSLPFAIEAENQLISHRYPSIFQNHFNTLTGCIYHLGNITESARNGIFTSYELLSEKWKEQEETKFLEFDPKVFPFIQNIISTLIKASPVSEVLFTSDYQFCETKEMNLISTTLEYFYELHRKNNLMCNVGYIIKKSA